MQCWRTCWIPKQDLAPIIQDYDALLDTLAARWQREGLIPSTYAGLPFEQRFARVALDAGKAGINWIQYFDFSYPQGGLTADTPIHQSAAVFNLLVSPRLLDVAEKLIGPEIVVNPIHHVRLKPPEAEVPEALRGGLTARTPWHQDQGVALPEADDTDILTVWLPITDATVENGCLCVIPGSQRSDLVTHCPGYGGLHIPDSLLAGAPVPVPMAAGSVLLLHRLTQHASLTQHEHGHPLELRSALSARGQAHGAAGVPGVSRPQPGAPRAGRARLARLGRHVGGGPGRPDAEPRSCLQSLVGARAGLRVRPIRA